MERLGSKNSFSFEELTIKTAASSQKTPDGISGLLMM